MDAHCLEIQVAPLGATHAFAFCMNLEWSIYLYMSCGTSSLWVSTDMKI